MNPKRVVIVGAGFAGVRAALDLVDQSKIQLTLVNNTTYHFYTPELYEIPNLIKTDNPELLENCSLCIPLTKIFEGRKINLVIDEVSEVDLKSNQVATKKNGNIPYDFLILGLGSKTFYFGVLGAEENSVPFKSISDGVLLGSKIEQLITEKGELSVLIAGGGFTGVELAGKLIEHPKIAKVVIVEASPMILAGMPEWAQELALDRLKKTGVEILLNSPIAKVLKDGVELKTGQKVETDLTVWTAGITGESINDQISGASLSDKGRLEVNLDLRLPSYLNVLVVGDLSQTWNSKLGGLVPATAWAAIDEGRQAAKNIKLMLKGYQPKQLKINPPGFVVPIGTNFALSNVFGLHLQGFIVVILKRLIYLKYLISILPIISAIKWWSKGVKVS